MNGVKDMEGYRETVNLSWELGGDNDTASCDSDDGVGTGAILVR